MDANTIKKRILSKLDWKKPKELYQWRTAAGILKDCGYDLQSFVAEKGYNYLVAQTTLSKITEEKVEAVECTPGGRQYLTRLYLVPPARGIRS